MPDRTLSCPNCGAPLDVSEGDTAVVCGYCDSDIRITDDGRAIPFFDRETRPGRRPRAEAVRPQERPGRAEDLAEVRQLAQSGRKIEAIKRYRELRDTSLAEAKAAVEAFERGETPAPWTPPADPRSESSVDWRELVRMVRNGQKAEAARRYREQTGKSMEESLRMMDRLEAGSRTGWRSCSGGCSRLAVGIFLFFFLLFAGCGQYIRTTDLHACVIDQIASSRAFQDALGRPVAVSPFVFVLGYNSESSFGGRSERSAGYFTIAEGPRGRSILFVDAYNNSSGYYEIEVSPILNRNDFSLQSSGDISTCLRNR